MKLAVFLLGVMILTSYRSVPAQTKPDDPWHTSIGERCNVHGVAVSQDLLVRWGGSLHYGDLVYIEGVGWRVINDVMAPRWHHRADIWVETYQEEKRFGIRKGRIWLVKGWAE